MGRHRVGGGQGLQWAGLVSSEPSPKRPTAAAVLLSPSHWQFMGSKGGLFSARGPDFKRGNTKLRRKNRLALYHE